MYTFKWPVVGCGIAYKDIYTVALAIHHLHKTVSTCTCNSNNKNTKTTSQ